MPNHHEETWRRFIDGQKGIAFTKLVEHLLRRCSKKELLNGFNNHVATLSKASGHSEEQSKEHIGNFQDYCAMRGFYECETPMNAEEFAKIIRDHIVVHYWDMNIKTDDASYLLLYEFYWSNIAALAIFAKNDKAIRKALKIRAGLFG